MAKSRRTRQSLLKQLSRKQLLLAGVFIILLGGGVFAYSLLKNNSPKQPNITDEVNGQGDDINYSPPTEEEKAETERHKKSLSTNSSDSTPQSSTDKKQVTPIITYASLSEVRAYVPGIFEDGGTCTVKATMGNQVRPYSSIGFSDVNKTSCAPIKMSLANGSWSVVVSYNSSTAQGKSAAREVN